MYCKINDNKFKADKGGQTMSHNNFPFTKGKKRKIRDEIIFFFSLREQIMFTSKHLGVVIFVLQLNYITGK